MRVTVGIHADGSAAGVADTLAHLRRYTTERIQVSLLADGFEDALRGDFDDIKIIADPVARGAPACFNRFVKTVVDAELLVFLEAGALVGPGWLTALVAALDADPRHGLAGPSTNRAWDLQAAFPDAREDEIERTAAEALARYGGSWRGTEPLHSLADFCYAVRRTVVDTVGPADETYGLGPCWEMDYTVRAVRSGFRAIWARGAYVFRRPASERRVASETTLFEQNRRLYQDRFCGLKLTGVRPGYARHCRGENCRHFAPPELMASGRLGSAASTAAAAALINGPPLVSCIMPSSGRADWMVQAIRYFQAQDYPARELIIIDDGAADRTGEISGDTRIRYHHLERRTSIGAKRNRACELARGTVIAHWDDDDWYAPGRLTAQLAPLLRREADVTGLTGTRFFDVQRWQFWTCTSDLHRRLFLHDVHGGTLVFWRDLFERLARYPDSSLAEDAVFLRAAIARGARLQAIPADELFLYVRHGGNAWAFTCGQHLDTRGWRRIEEPGILGSDRGFYAERSSCGDARSGPVTVCTHEPLPGITGPSDTDTSARLEPRINPVASAPLVSCIMPTYNRRPFVPRAIEYFLRQDYPNCELVILDDGEDQVADLVPDLPVLRYVALPERLRLGIKRNAAIQASRGDIIVHWDDDDWMDKTRVSSQVSALRAANADICGVSKVWFCEIASGRLSVFRYPPTERRWLYGASLCYRRSLWQQKPFDPVDIGEDTRFVWAHPGGRLLDLGELRFMIAMIHAENTSRPRPLTGPNWLRWDHGTARDVLGNDWTFYGGLAQQRRL